MKKKLLFLTFLALAVVVAGPGIVQAGTDIQINGSFEDDNYIGDITVKAPNDWNDVNVPANQFDGYVSSNWVTDGSYNLTLTETPVPDICGQD